MNKTEKKIIDFITNHYEIFMLIIFLILSLILRKVMINFISGDYYCFLSKWFDNLKANGGIHGLGSYTGDYNAPYVILLSILTYIPVSSLISIKMLSISFDYLLAFLAAKFVYDICDDENFKKICSVITFLALIFLPTIVVNGSMWAQCDVIYTFFAVLSLYFISKDKFSLSFISYGISLSFKLQAVFILPIFIILYLKKKKFSILNFFWIPIANIVLSLPSIIANKSILGAFTVYLNQMKTYKKLSLNFPNFYELINFNNEFFSANAANIFGITICLLIFSILLYLTLKSKKKLDFKNVLLLSIISTITCVYFLPHMHERYMFMADIICIIYAFAYRKRIGLAIIVELFSLNAYFMFISEAHFIPTYISSIILLLVLVNYINDYLQNIGIKNVKELT